jgi:hypothetical protein
MSERRMSVCGRCGAVGSFDAQGCINCRIAEKTPETGELETAAEERAAVQLDFREDELRGRVTGSSGGYQSRKRPALRYLGD